MTVRPARAEDLPGILAIYNDVVAKTTAIYRETPATLEDRTEWWKSRVDVGYPLLVAAGVDGVEGFASFGDFRAWPGYRFTLEHTVHVRSDRRGRGVGRALMLALIEEARRLDKHVMIGGVDADNQASLRFHEGLGFRQAGRLEQVGFKFGRWLDLVFVQLVLGPGGSAMSRDSRGVALYALLCLIWGSTWLVIKVGYGGLGPFNVAALRFFLAAGVLAVLVPVLGVSWPRGRSEWTLVGVVGLVLFAGDYGLIYWAEQYLDSGLTAILFATLPLITVGMAYLYVPGERITARTVSGTVVAFIGIIVLFGDHVRLDPTRLGPMLSIVAAAVCAAAAAVATKRHGHGLHPAALNAPAMFVGAAALTAASFAAGQGFVLPRTLSAWGAIAYLAVAGSVVTFLIFFGLLKTWSVTSLSFISIFTPAVALLLGVVFLDERLTLLTLAGTLLILAGVALALTRPASRA